MSLHALALTLLISFALLATAQASTDSSTPALNLKITPRDMICDICFERYDFCVENGHTRGQTGCKQTCAEHVCHVQRRRGIECSQCGHDFSACGEKSRYDY